MTDERTNTGSIDWGDSIEVDSREIRSIPDGSYLAIVEGYDRDWFAGSDRIPSCNKAVIRLTVDSPDGPFEMKSALLLHKKLEWKLSQFFRSIGQKEAGKPLTMDWSRVAGSLCRVYIRNRTFKKFEEVETYPEVEKFYDYDPAYFTEIPAWMEETKQRLSPGWVDEAISAEDMADTSVYEDIF